MSEPSDEVMQRARKLYLGLMATGERWDDEDAEKDIPVIARALMEAEARGCVHGHRRSHPQERTSIMTERKDDGGPAFPFVKWRSPDGMVDVQQDAGMSLRDWFAGQALEWAGAKFYTNNPEFVATRAYQMADAMLAERAKK